MEERLQQLLLEQDHIGVLGQIMGLAIGKVLKLPCMLYGTLTFLQGGSSASTAVDAYLLLGTELAKAVPNSFSIGIVFKFFVDIAKAPFRNLEYELSSRVRQRCLSYFACFWPLVRKHSEMLSLMPELDVYKLLRQSLHLCASFVDSRTQSGSVARRVAFAVLSCGMQFDGPAPTPADTDTASTELSQLRSFWEAFSTPIEARINASLSAFCASASDRVDYSVSDLLRHKALTEALYIFRDWEEIINSLALMAEDNVTMCIQDSGRVCRRILFRQLAPLHRQYASDGELMAALTVLLACINSSRDKSNVLFTCVLQVLCFEPEPEADGAAAACAVSAVQTLCSLVRHPQDAMASAALYVIRELMLSEELAPQLVHAATAASALASDSEAGGQEDRKQVTSGAADLPWISPINEDELADSQRELCNWLSCQFLSMNDRSGSDFATFVSDS